MYLRLMRMIYYLAKRLEKRNYPNEERVPVLGRW